MVSPLNTDDTGMHPLTEWLMRRLTGPRGRQDWNRLVEAAWRHTSTIPLRTLMPTETLRDVVLAQLRPDRLPDFLRPITRSLLPRLLELHRNDDAPLGRWVPDTARGALERLASRPGLIHEDWIRALFRQRVAEAVMADALYRGIRDFSTIMPRLMLSLMPTQRFSRLGGATIIGKRIVEELEKKLEPEIKTFLEGGTKKALSRAADFAVEHKDDEAAKAFRRNIVQFVLSKSPSFHVQGVSEDMLADLEPIVTMITKHMATREETHRLAIHAIEEIDRVYGDMTLAEALRAVGYDSEPDHQAWASLTWPVLVECMKAPEIRVWLEELVRDFLEFFETEYRPSS